MENSCVRAIEGAGGDGDARHQETPEAAAAVELRRGIRGAAAARVPQSRAGAVEADSIAELPRVREHRRRRLGGAVELHLALGRSVTTLGMYIRRNKL